MDEATRSLWLVDGYNVLRVSLSPEVAGQPWWTEDRRQLLMELASNLGSNPGPDGGPGLPERLSESDLDVWVVFDRRRRAGDPKPTASESEVAGPVPGPPPRTPRCVFAPSADEWIVRALKAQRTTDAGLGPAQAPGATGTVVVTADRRLANRCRHHGAEIVTTGSFVALCGGTRARS